MRHLACVVLILACTAVLAQTDHEKDRTLAFINSLRDAKTGAYAVQAKPDTPLQPSVRACNGALRAKKYLGQPITDTKAMQQFVLGQYDAKTGTFSEPGEATNPIITSIGLMAALELDSPREPLAKVFDSLQTTAKSFEELRLVAAAIEAWGPKECPYKPEEYLKALAPFRLEYLNAEQAQAKPTESARMVASVTASVLRVSSELTEKEATWVPGCLLAGQRADGGWGQAGVVESDLDTTYRVMRSLSLLKLAPKEPARLRDFVQSCRKSNGGYGTTAKADPSLSGVYYAVMVEKWLKELEQK